MKSLVESAVATRKQQAEPEVAEFGAPKIMVVGVGGAGNNTINRLAQMGVKGAQMIAINTDKQHLALISDQATKILIGKSVTRGLGAGGFPEVARKSAEVSRASLEEALKGVDLVFICLGLGGGTGTGAAPVVAEIAKNYGAITICVANFPFALERARVVKAEQGLRELQSISDTVIILDNNRLVELVPNLPIQDAFRVADEIIARAVMGITETITQPSLINLDFADVRAIMSNQGLSMIAVGESRGVNRVEEVVEDTLKNALLDVDTQGAKGVLIHISGSNDMTIGEANAIGEMLTEKVDPNATVIWGARVDPTLEDRIQVIAIFTNVKSPYIKGREQQTAYSKSGQRDDLGIGYL
jgi:cell division protein FtsZ